VIKEKFMKRFQDSRLSIFLFVVLAVLALPGAGFADTISLDLAAPHQTVSQGEQVAFSGTLNIFGADLTSTYINGAAQTGSGFEFLTLGDTLVTFDDFSFLMNVLLADPLFRLNTNPAANDPEAWTSATFDLFTITAGISAPVGTYTGQFQVFGGPDPFAQDLVALADFSVEVVPSAVPEPSSLLLCALGAGALALSRFHIRKVRQS
jgi:hypothetical protein